MGITECILGIVFSSIGILILFDRSEKSNPIVLGAGILMTFVGVGFFMALILTPSSLRSWGKMKINEMYQRQEIEIERLDRLESFINSFPCNERFVITEERHLKCDD